MTQRENSGKLSRNKKKDVENPDHEKWPDFDGDVLIDGKRYWIAAWIKESKEDRHKFFSLGFKKMVPKKHAEADRA
jgi:hypothetical protein